MDWRQALQECAAAVDKEMPRVLADLEPPSLREAAMHYPRAGGKRLRPALAMLACEAAGGKREQALHAGIAVELVHNFSLVHDDIMDKDATRRGLPSVHVKFGEPAAILAGDALFAKAFEALDLAPARAEQKVAMLRELALATRKLCEGQQRDMELQASEHATPQHYYDMIHGKTGRLYECATRLGGLAAGAGAERVAALATYGKELGRAFQVRDDILGVTGDEAKLGKPWGSDIRNGKRTILALMALERAKGADAATLRKALGNAAASARDIEAAVAVLRSTRALDDAQAEALRAAQDAAKALRALPPGGARTALEDLARFSAERDH